MVCFLPWPSLAQGSPGCALPGKWEFGSVAARGCAGIEAAKELLQRWDALGIGQNAGFQLVWRETWLSALVGDSRIFCTCSCVTGERSSWRVNRN